MTLGAHRKVVTVLFCDVVGSTALGESVDPEALQALLAGYFDRMKGIVESHGGSVEKFIGDAVMAVFGVPLAHEDDALRACRAAVEMREAFPELGLAGHIGVNTGEVLAGTEERLATGDALNVAARLEQAAQPGEVLIGAETLALVGDVVEVGEERLLELKGKSEPVAAHPLVSVLEISERSHASRFVGRDRELQELVDAWDRALAGPRCELVTVVGDPGVGKSRLVAEALTQVDARVVRARCLSYGDGITYWPVVEVVKQLDVLPSDESAANAIRSLLGESETVAGTDEIAWAFRKLLEEQAPLFICFDDIQWGEETFLDLVESVALLSTGAPLLLLCMARPELLDRRTSWPATLRLQPLPEEQAALLVGDTVRQEMRRAIVHASGGNPLFLTEMLALAASGDDVEVPPTLRALLAARLDQLDGRERHALECGAVEGELFHRGTVQALAPEETEVTPRLAALVRKELLHPDQPTLPREDAYRFRHLLIRDAAYDALPKATRANLHRRLAAWLEEHGQSLVELDELLGYHLEQAACYLDELGQAEPELALLAGDRLAAAGRRAIWRGDDGAARGLLERALTLTRRYRLNLHLELDLARAANQDAPIRATRIADAAADAAEATGDKAGTLLARTVAGLYRLQTGECSADELERLAREALPLLEEADDHHGLAEVWHALAYGVANMRGSFEEWAFAAEQVIQHARLAWPHDRGLHTLSKALVEGPRPARRALETLDSLLPGQPPPRDMAYRAMLIAMLDRLDEAKELGADTDERLREFGFRAGAAQQLGRIAIIAGDQETAAKQLRRFCVELEAMDYRAALSTYAPLLGRVLSGLGRHDEAEPLAAQGRNLGDPDDAWTQVYWRLAQALVHSARGQHAEAERLAREAVEIANQTDSLWMQGDAYCDLARVLEARGRRNDTTAALHKALDRYERKEIIPLARRVRERLAAVQETAI